MEEDIFAEDIIAVSDEGHQNLKPNFAPSGGHSPPSSVHADASASKRKADHPAEANAEGYKRLRSADNASPAEPVGHHMAKNMVYKIEVELAAAEDKGSRVEMEDIHVIKVDARRDRDSACRVIWAAVFDGHAGKQVAALASKHLHENTVASGFLNASNFLVERSASSMHPQALDIKAMRKAIATGFAVTDQQALAQAQLHHWLDGAVCVAVWIVQDTVFVANVGDARCVLGRALEKTSSNASKAVLLTKEHKALFSEERRRIEKAGGFVRNGRLQGKIEVSRSIGDLQFKKCGMSAVPDIQVFNLGQQDRFLLCGCDGFWSCFSPEDAVQAVAGMIEKGKPLKAVCDRLIYLVLCWLAED